MVPTTRPRALPARTLAETRESGRASTKVPRSISAGGLKNPRPPGRSWPTLAVPLTCSRKHGTNPRAGCGEALRIHERAADVLGRLGAGEPPHDLEVRAEELIEDPVLRG